MKIRTIKETPFNAAYAKAASAQDHDAGWLAAMRQAGLDRIDAEGLPNALTEEWKYTSLKPVTEHAFAPAVTADGLDVHGLPHTALELSDCDTYVFVNGAFRDDLSSYQQSEAVQRLSAAITENAELTKRYLGGQAKADTSHAVALNAAFMNDGLFIHAGEGEKLSRPVHIVHVGAGSDQPLASHPRSVIVLEKGAEATVIESFVGLPGQTYLVNPVSEVSVGSDAELTHLVFQNEDDEGQHLGTVFVSAAAKARYDGFALSLGGALVRREYRMDLIAPAASVQLNGVYAVSGTQHHDFTTVTDHGVPDTISNQVFKGLLAGKSRGVYQGKIHVARAAQRTDGKLLHKALMLDRGPEVDVKPELEIYADDVQCAHGAAIGELDNDQLFYLMSRGVSEPDARDLLVQGFIDDVLTMVPLDAAREAFTQKVHVWLARQAESGGRNG